MKKDGERATGQTEAQSEGENLKAAGKRSRGRGKDTKGEVRPAGSEGGIRMKEGMQRPVSLQTKVRRQNTQRYTEEKEQEG